MANDIGYQPGEVLAYAYLASMYERAERFDRALDCHQRVLRLAQGLGMRPEQAHASLGIGRAYASLGTVGEAGEHLAHACTLFTGLGLPEARQAKELLTRVGGAP
jgi:tetratricopeptide (TPR) repeat protein